MVSACHSAGPVSVTGGLLVSNDGWIEPHCPTGGVYARPVLVTDDIGPWLDYRARLSSIV